METFNLRPATPVYYSQLSRQPAASLQASGLSLSSGSGSAAGSEISEFKDLMTLMLLSMSMPSQSSSDDVSGMGGMSMTGLLAPLMLSLLEKLMAKQVETEETIPNQPASPTPQGRPIEGHLTQGSHPGHIALDFGAPVGTDVKATMDGQVVYAGWNNEGYGNLVIVENGPYRTYYAHLSKIPVEVGQEVKAGSVVGLSGNTGNSTGPHLHYEVRENGQQIDPTSFTISG
jgi:biotin carboxyl carrier protein